MFFFHCVQPGVFHTHEWSIWKIESGCFYTMRYGGVFESDWKWTLRNLLWTADPDHNKECQQICWYLEYTSRQRIYSYTPVGVLPMKSLGSVRWVFVRHLLWCITFGYYLFLEIYFFFYVVLPWFGDKYNVIMYAKRQVRWMLKEIWFGISPALLFLRHASCPCPETPECTMYSFVSFDSIMLWNLIRLHDIRRNHLPSWVTSFEYTT